MENPVNNALKENLNASAEHPISTSNRNQLQQTTILGKMRDIEKEASEWLSKQFDNVIFIGDSFDFICTKDNEKFAIEVGQSIHDIDREQFRRIVEKAQIANASPIFLYKNKNEWIFDSNYFLIKQKTREQVKKSQNSFLLLLLSRIKEDKPKDIAVQLGISKQDLNYHLQKLIKLNILFREQSYPFAIYRLTDLGERVKESLIQSEHPKSLWRVHNLIIGFRIFNLGSFNFVETTRRKLIRMRNWSYAREEMDGYVINVQDTGLLKIYVPAKYTKDPDLAIGEMISEADRIAADYINRYDMKLQRLEIVRKAEKELQNSEVLTKIFGRIKTEGIYVNESDGFAALEEKQDSYVIEDLLKLPEKVDGLEKHLIKQTQIMDQFSKNIELHLAVLTELRDAIKILGGESHEKATKTFRS